MLGVHYVGARCHPCVRWKNEEYLMEHRVYVTPRTPADTKDFWVFKGKPVAIDCDLFWLFGFSPSQVDCVYQGPAPLPESFLQKVVPTLRDAVRAELETGKDQHVVLNRRSEDAGQSHRS